ncbi:MAG: oligoendopeptidase F [Mycoplasma sp.]|nr:oligoendopeptidase F [Mycoplasma sp.]
MSQAKQYKKHKDVEKKYTWDLESILEGKTYEYWLEKGIEYYKKLIKIKDSKYKSSENFLSALKLEDESDIIFNKINNYLSNKNNQDISNPKIKEMIEEFDFNFFQLQKEFGSEKNRIFKYEKNVNEWIKLPEFKNYKKNISDILENKKHKLSNEVEEYINKTSRASISASSTFEIITDSELDYKYATSSKGKKIKINDANRIKLMKSKDENIRKTTSQNFIGAYLKHKQSLSNLLFQHFKNIAVMSKVRNFNSAIESQIKSDKVDIKLLETLYKSVQEGKKSFKKYKEIHGKIFNIKYKKKFNSKWDSYLPLVDIKDEFTIEEAQEIVLESLKPMGKEYIDVIKKAFNERWIDYMTIKNKRSGAYSIGGSYGLEKKYILMNWDGELRSIETLTHELGHSMHSYFSDKNQPISLSSYPIFLAEIASIFNELMLTDHLLKTSDNDKLKFKLLEQAITGFSGTVMRQTEWSNYEFNLLKAIEDGRPLSSFESISKLYYENQKKYSIKTNLKYKEETTFASIYVPHYYYGFYVYKYAIGYTVATVFFKRYKNEGPKALQNYINNFLSAGARDWPIQILKDAGIDLYDKNIYKEAFAQLDEFISEYIKLGKKIFKIK